MDYYKVPGEIYCADLFNPPNDLLEKFDLVVSFGVVEHFEDTAQCLKSCEAFLKPGGILFTLIPNMTGILGFVQKLLDRDVYEIHVPLTQKKLAQAHQRENLNLKTCEYFTFINLNVLNSGSFSSHILNQYLRHILSGISKIFWKLERYGVKIPGNRYTSPYLIAISEK